MLINVKGTLDPAHYDIILAESLINEKGDFYDLTLKQALDELVKDEGYVCDYQVDLQKSLEACTLKYFMAWTKTKVIFNQTGPFTRDSLLDSVPRHPT